MVFDELAFSDYNSVFYLMTCMCIVHKSTKMGFTMFYWLKLFLYAPYSSPHKTHAYRPYICIYCVPHIFGICLTYLNSYVFNFCCC